MNTIAHNPAVKWIGAIITVLLTGVVLYLIGVGSVYLLALILKLISGNA